MSLILIKAFFARFFSNRCVWYAIGAGAVVYGLVHWHNKKVDAAVKLNTEQLTAQFTAEKQKTIDDEAARSRTIVATITENYDAQVNILKSDAARLVANHRTGTVRLSVPAVCASPIVAGNSGRTESNPFGVATESRAELSDAAVRFFVSEAERADQQAIQLNTLVDVIDGLRLGVGATEEAK